MMMPLLARAFPGIGAIVACLPMLIWTSQAEAQDGDPASDKIAIKVGKILTCTDDESTPETLTDAVILVAEGKVQALGSSDEIEIPDGYQVIDHSDHFAMPGLVEAHSHVGGSMGDINEMVYQTNPELGVVNVIDPNNDQLKDAIAGGVTTICFIPGSGTNMGGFGALLKTGPGTLDEVLIRYPGVLKIAQSGNPERRTGEVGSGRMGMNYVIRQQLAEGRKYVTAWDAYEAGQSEQPEYNPRLELFKPLFHKEIPVVVHTQAYQVIQSTLRILVDEMDLKVVIDHGTFDSYKISDEILKRNIPVMAGPRGFRYEPEDGQIHGVVAEFDQRGIEMLGVNTDAGVIPQEELFFQAAMAVRLGWNEEEAIRGITIEPAKALMVADRVGSLEPGKDADIVITNGSILDPRTVVHQVLIDGRSVYDITKDRRRF